MEWKCLKKNQRFLVVILDGPHTGLAYPSMSTRAYVPFKPTTPQREEGIRTEPAFDYRVNSRAAERGLRESIVATS